jgi:hypothetical protein
LKHQHQYNEKYSIKTNSTVTLKRTWEHF